LPSHYPTLCNSIAFAPTWAWTRDSAHISHPRGIITHHSTKATALAEQGEQLLQVLRINDVTDWNAISAHHR
jgi:hypothetical protein